MRSRNAETGDITITRDGVEFTLDAGDITFVLDCQRMRRFERVVREHGWQPTVSWVGAEPEDADEYFAAVSDTIIATLTNDQDAPLRGQEAPQGHETPVPGTITPERAPEGSESNNPHVTSGSAQ